MAAAESGPQEYTREDYIREFFALYEEAGSPDEKVIAKWIKDNTHRRVASPTIAGWIHRPAPKAPRQELQFLLVVRALRASAARRSGRELLALTPYEEERWRKLRAAMNRRSQPSGTGAPKEDAEPSRQAAVDMDARVPTVPAQGRTTFHRYPMYWIIGSLFVVAALVATWVGLSSADQDEAAAQAPPPFTWTVRIDDEGSFMLGGRLDVPDLGPVPPYKDSGFQKWALARNGIVAPMHKDENGNITAESGTSIHLTASDPGIPVTLMGMEVEVLESLPPAEGTLVRTQTGGAKTARYLVVDGDVTPPAVVRTSDTRYSSDITRAEPALFPYDISSTASELFTIYLRTRQHLKWQVRISWSTGATSGSTVIDNHGKPFEVTYVPEETKTCGYWISEWRC